MTEGAPADPPIGVTRYSQGTEQTGVRVGLCFRRGVARQGRTQIPEARRGNHGESPADQRLREL